MMKNLEPVELSDPANHDQSRNGSEKTVLEFFAGIGLMRLGLEKQGWKIIFANDIDPAKHEIYSANYSDADKHFVLEDIHKLGCAQIPEATLATASFPCNDLSVAGGRDGIDGKQSSAFWGFIEILKQKGLNRPAIVLLENVVGFLTSHGGEDFERALEALNALGYSVDAFIIDAANFVPQSRRRMFVVGKLGAKSISQPLIFTSDVRPQPLIDFIISRPKIKWSIQNLPPLPTSESKLSDILQDISSDSPLWWSEERSSYLISQMSPKHWEVAEQMINKKRWSYGTVFRRVRKGKSMAELRVDGVAGCLRTPRGGSGRQILFKAGFGKYSVRLLSPEECGRLMGAAGLNLPSNINQSLFGFGDAVCVPVIEWIAKEYLNKIC